MEKINHSTRIKPYKIKTPIAEAEISMWVQPEDI